MDWPPGTRVMVLGPLFAMPGVICFRGNDCEEDGAPTYRVAMQDGLEAVFCSTVLVRADPPTS